MRINLTKKSDKLVKKASVLFNQGFQLNQVGKLEEARALYEKVINLNPNHYDALNLLGVILFQNGQVEKALSFINKSIEIESKNEYAHLNKGYILRNIGNFIDALDSFNRALAISPKFAAAHFNRGTTLEELNFLEEAIKCYDNALIHDPHFANAYINKGNALKKQHKLNEALVNYNNAINLAPYDFEAHYNNGNTLKELCKFREAIASYDIAIQLNPAFAEAYINRGNAFKEINNFMEAFSNYQTAIDINPNLSEAFVSLSSLQYNLNQFADALRNASIATHISQDFAEAYLNKANAEKALNLLDEALRSINTSISLNHNYIEAYWNKSLILLLLGDYSEGFQLYEYRWSLAKSKKILCSLPPLWLGNESLKEKSILLVCEQGYGDTIQFSRYISDVHALGAKVFIEVPKPLSSIFECFSNYATILLQGKQPPHSTFDFYCPLMSLPLAFKTKLDSIPSASRYLNGNPTKIQYWKGRLRNINGLKVGIVWNGGFRPNQPEVWAINERRNIPLEIFSSVLNSTPVNFFSLQKGEPAESELSDKGGAYWPLGNLYNFSDELKDFSDTAALIENLDLVISVDTSTAHLSAALGKPTWILNRFDNCWRWLINRNDSPWYPSVKLYRQTQHGDWKTVLSLVKNDLNKLINH
jgi:tetratricopeptide (TPR) repeat protein